PGRLRPAGRGALPRVRARRPDRAGGAGGLPGRARPAGTTGAATARPLGPRTTPSGPRLMNDDFLAGPAGAELPATRSPDTLGSSTIYKLCEEVIALREFDKRQLRLLEQTFNKVRDELK